MTLSDLEGNFIYRNVCQLRHTCALYVVTSGLTQLINTQTLDWVIWRTRFSVFCHNTRLSTCRNMLTILACVHHWLRRRLRLWQLFCINRYVELTQENVQIAWSVARFLCGDSCMYADLVYGSFPLLSDDSCFTHHGTKIPNTCSFITTSILLTAGLLLTFLSTPKYAFIQALVAYSVSDF